LKKQAGSVRFQFYKQKTEKTEPNRNRKQWEKNQAKPSQNGKTEAKPSQTEKTEPKSEKQSQTGFRAVMTAQTCEK
jgi:hypothetical protein